MSQKAKCLDTALVLLEDLISAHNSVLTAKLTHVIELNRPQTALFNCKCLKDNNNKKNYTFTCMRDFCLESKILQTSARIPPIEFDTFGARSMPKINV